MTRGLFRMLVRCGHLAHALAQTDRSRAALQRSLQALQRAIGRAVLNEQLGIQERGLDFADSFFLIVTHVLITRGHSPPPPRKVYHKRFSCNWTGLKGLTS